MPNRRRTAKTIEAQVLIQSGRRCCFCFGLNGDFAEKRGQIAHLDKNPSNAQLDNLAFLCLEHHDLYDSRTSQSKGLTIEEAKYYRSSLHKSIQELRLNKEVKEASVPKPSPEQTVYYLPRIRTGNELVNVAANAHFYVIKHDNFNSELEAHIIGNFLQHVIDFCEDLQATGPKFWIETALHFDSRIAELEENDFKVFGRRQIEKKEVSGIFDDWIFCYLSVIRVGNPSIINLEEVLSKVGAE